MKIISVLTLLLTLVTSGCADGNRSSSQMNRDEPSDPQQIDTAKWNGIAGTHASFGCVDMRYARSAPFSGDVLRSANLTGWRGEKLSAQVVVWTAVELKELRCTVGDFISADGKGLKLEKIGRGRFVRYVLSDRFDPEKPCGARPDGKYPAMLSPDLLDESPALDLEAHTSRPIWITVDVPRDAPAGTYRSEIRLRAAGGYQERLTLNLEVIARSLPPASQWTYYLDLWQHPSAVARIEKVAMWSDEHFRLMKPTMQLLADAGQKVITANLNKDPWNNQTQFPYEDMIVWTRLGDGTWEYDFSVFDRWVTYMLDLGVRKSINCYSLLPWNNELHYIDEVSGKTVTVVAEPSGPLFREMWEPFLGAFTEHLRKKGWLEITNLAMDERSEKEMDIAMALLTEKAPELGIALTDNNFLFRKYPRIKDMCVSIFADMDTDDIATRRRNDQITTFYVCCSTGFPNTYTTSEPLEAVYLSWFAMARGYDGFLRWAYNAWTEDPTRDTRFRTWTAGDTFLVYPGGRSSIRFERFVEGVQDWEKMHLLRREFSTAGTLQAEENLRKLNDAIAPFGSGVPFDGWQQALNDAKKRINDLSRIQLLEKTN